MMSWRDRKKGTHYNSGTKSVKLLKTNINLIKFDGILHLQHFSVPFMHSSDGCEIVIRSHRVRTLQETIRRNVFVPD